MNTLSEWIESLRNSTGETQTEFGIHFRVDQATVSRWENGAEPGAGNWDALKAFAIERGFDLPYASSKRLARLVGFVSAGAQVNHYGNGQGPFGDVEMPFGGGKDMVAVEVRGESMSGLADDGWLLYYNDRHEPPHDGLFGKLCVIGLADDRVLVKRLMRGRGSGLFDLYSTNATPLFDQAVIWAAKVEWIRQP